MYTYAKPLEGKLSKLIRGRPRSWTDEELIKSVKYCTSWSQVLVDLDLSKNNINVQSVKQRVQDLKLDISHFGVSRYLSGKHISEILVKDSTYKDKKTLKLKVLNLGLVEDRCYICGRSPIWRKKKLTLQLDHRNGVRNDHRIENLRMLCPNCHSQTKTYGGKSRKKVQNKVVKEKS
jgi:5-methylcytosine-specific restriction endonuclease McrA